MMMMIIIIITTKIITYGDLYSALFILWCSNAIFSEDKGNAIKRAKTVPIQLNINNFKNKRI